MANSPSVTLAKRCLQAATRCCNVIVCLCFVSGPTALCVARWPRSESAARPEIRFFSEREALILYRRFAPRPAVGRSRRCRRTKIQMISRAAAAAAAVLFLHVMCCSAPSAPSFCYDRKPDCPNWASDGECSGKNAVFMLSTCPLSCRMCTQSTCDDTSPSCTRWMREGMCESKPRTTLKACSTSCGSCTVRCIDRHEECDAWASEGECASHADFMTEACPVACGTCLRSCVDRHDDCPGWTAGGECW